MLRECNGTDVEGRCAVVDVERRGLMQLRGGEWCRGADRHRGEWLSLKLPSSFHLN